MIKIRPVKVDELLFTMQLMSAAFTGAMPTKPGSGSVAFGEGDDIEVFTIADTPITRSFRAVHESLDHLSFIERSSLMLRASECMEIAHDARFSDFVQMDERGNGVVGIDETLMDVICTMRFSRNGLNRETLLRNLRTK